MKTIKAFKDGNKLFVNYHVRRQSNTVFVKTVIRNMGELLKRFITKLFQWIVSQFCLKFCELLLQTINTPPFLVQLFRQPGFNVAFYGGIFLMKFLRWNSSLFNWRRRKCRLARRSFPGSTVHFGRRRQQSPCTIKFSFQLDNFVFGVLLRDFFSILLSPAYKLRLVIGL